jgi:hypothetical protein
MAGRVVHLVSMGKVVNEKMEQEEFLQWAKTRTPDVSPLQCWFESLGADWKPIVIAHRRLVLPLTTTTFLSQGRIFSTYDMTLGKPSGAKHIMSYEFLLNTFWSKSSHSNPFNVEEVFIECFQLQDALYCGLCLSKNIFGLISPIRYINKGTTSLARHLKSCHQSPLSTTKVGQISKEFAEKLVCLTLLRNNLPFRLVDDEMFRHIISPFSGELPHRTTISTRVLTDLFHDFVEAFKSLQLKIFHISFDLWSSIAMRHYALVTAQWLQDWKLHRAAIAILPLDGESAKEIVNAVRSAFSGLGIQEERVFTICTDGASNEVAAATFKGFCDNAEHIWCFLHQLNLCIGDAFHGRCRARVERENGRNGWSPSSQVASVSTTIGRHPHNRFWKQMEIPRGKELPNLENFEPQIRSHDNTRQTIQKMCEEITTDYLFAENEPDENDIAEVRKEILVLTKMPSTAMELWKCVRQIIQKFRISHSNRKLLKKACEETGIQFKVLLLYSTTRWIGSYHEFARFVELEKAFVHLSQGPLASVFVLPRPFFDACRELTDILLIFAYPIHSLQTATEPLVSKQIVWARLIVMNLEKEKARMTQVVCSTFLDIALSSLRSRFHVLLSDYDDVENPDLGPYIAASMFDITIRKLWSKDFDKNVKLFIQYSLQLYDMFPHLGIEEALLNLRTCQPNSHKRKRSPNIDPFSEVAQRFQLDSLFTEEKSDDLTTPDSTHIDPGKPSHDDLKPDLERELRRYLYRVSSMTEGDFNAYSNAFDFWSKAGQFEFPSVAVLASVILGQPLGTVDTERRCSEAGNVITKIRNRLGDEKINKIWMIHGNCKEDWVLNSPQVQPYLGFLQNNS